jgi:hypothetical protein
MMAVRAAYAAGFEAEAKTPDGMMESRAFRSRRERQETSRLRLLPAASPPEAPIEAPPGAGLVHAYLIDTDPARRAQVHKQLSGRSNMVVRAYRDYASFLAEADLLDAGCVILSPTTAWTRKIGAERRMRGSISFASPGRRDASRAFC